MKVNFILSNGTFFFLFSTHIDFWKHFTSKDNKIQYKKKKNQQFVRYFTLKGKILDIKIWNISRIIDLVDIASSCSVRQNVSKNRRIKENGRSSARNKGVFVQFRIKQNSYSSSDPYISYRELTLSNVPRNKTSGYSVYEINKSWDIKYRKRFRIFRGKFKYFFPKVIFFNDAIAVLIPQPNWPLSWVWTHIFIQFLIFDDRRTSWTRHVI